MINKLKNKLLQYNIFNNTYEPIMAVIGILMLAILLYVFL